MESEEERKLIGSEFSSGTLGCTDSGIEARDGSDTTLSIGISLVVTCGMDVTLSEIGLKRGLSVLSIFVPAVEGLVEDFVEQVWIEE